MQAFGDISLGGKFRFEAFRHTFEAELTHIPQNSVLAREIAEESRLADFENFDNIIDASFLVTLFAEQSDGCVDNLLTKSRLLALPKPWDLVVLRRVVLRCVVLRWRVSLHQASVIVIPASSRCGDSNKNHSRIFSWSGL